MKEFLITTDACSDLPEEYLQENNIKSVPLYYNLDGVIYGDEEKIEPYIFYEKMRGGLMPTTMACNPEAVKDAFKRILEKGYDILHVAFSSALSSSYNSAVLAANEVLEEFPNRKVLVIDSKCASLGQGLLVHKAVKLKENGKSIEEVNEWIENNKQHLCHQFTVNDLNHLHRGGRVSKATAMIGTLINVKPVLHVDDEGRLIPLMNVRGRKKSIYTLLDNMAKEIEGYENDVVFISHGDCLEEAEFLANLVREKLGITDIMINYVGPTIGTHSGPGTIALFFMGENR